jgi:hypothetical protein
MGTEPERDLLRSARDANLDILAKLSALLTEEGNRRESRDYAEKTSHRAFTIAQLASHKTIESLALLKSYTLIDDVVGKGPQSHIVWMSFALDNLRIPVGDGAQDPSHDFGLDKPFFLGTHDSPTEPPRIASITKEVVTQYLRQSRNDAKSCLGVCLTSAQLLGVGDTECVAVYQKNGEFACHPGLEIFKVATQKWNGMLTGPDKWSNYLNSFRSLARPDAEIKCLISATSFFNSLIDPRLKAAGQLIVAIDCVPASDQAAEVYDLMQIVLSGLPMAWNATQRLASDNLNLEKYRDMFNLLHGPLDGLQRSIDSMEQNVRSLNAVLLHPADGLFRQQRNLASLFEDGKRIDLSDRIPTIKISHNCEYANRQEDALLVLVLAAKKIFGAKLKFPERVNTKSAALDFAKVKLREYALAHPDRSDLATEFLFVCFADYVKTEFDVNDLELLLSEESHYGTKPNQRVSNLKNVLFTPFKLEESHWHGKALQLALRRFGDKVNFGSLDSKTQWDVASGWTPVGYSAVLEFFLRGAQEYNNRIGGKRALESVCVEYIKNKALSISLDFGEEPYLQGSINEVRSLKDFLHNHVLARDWRLDQSSVGNFRKPFVDLFSKALGLVTSSPSNGIPAWAPIAVGITEKLPHTLVLLKRGERCFELAIGDNKPGIQLRWYDASSTGCGSTAAGEVRG